MKHYKITDWAGNDLSYHHGHFKSFEDAEHALTEFINKAIEGTDEIFEEHRGEYWIEKVKG